MKTIKYAKVIKSPVPMDERDIDILKRLISNSRTPFREIADGLGLSVNGVYKRIKNLTDSGVIRDFQTTLDTRILNAIPIMVFGQCEAKSVEKVANLLGKNPHTNKILVAGGNYLYITAVFRNLRELQPYIETVKKKGYIPAPRVGLINIKRSEFWRIPRKPADLRLEDLSSLDFKIISALHRDSRRSAKDTSQELGVSTKTVRKRLSKLANKGYIQMNVLLAFDSSRDIFAILHLNLKKGQTANKVEALLINNHSKNILSIHTFSNLPNQILCSTWTNTMKEIKDIQNDLQKRGILESIVPNIFYTTYIYESWVDTLIDDLAKNPKMIQDFKKKSARGTRRIKADLVDMDTLGVIDTYRKALAQALDDGVITDDEEAILTSLRDSLNISDEQHNKILEFVKSRGALNKIEVDLYSKVLDQALEDSVITEDEEAILLSLRDSLSITDEMHKKLIEGKKKGK